MLDNRPRVMLKISPRDQRVRDGHGELREELEVRQTWREGPLSIPRTTLYSLTVFVKVEKNLPDFDLNAYIS